MGTNRYGKDFNPSQIKTHVGVALVKTFQTSGKFPNSEVLIALPNNKGHRKVVRSIYDSVAKTGINFLLVNDNGTVENDIYQGVPTAFDYAAISLAHNYIIIKCS